ncbi:MAG: ornithine carbamoyltransferase [Desulfovibrio sp.]|nr:ornithine carbamoyltransferase [Desulfovibrio sp.]
MARSFVTIKSLGEKTCWTLVEQAIGIPHPKMVSNFMDDRVALLLFSRQSLPERLCVTAAVRQMGGSTIYQGDQGGVWREEVHAFQKEMLGVFSYYMDCMYLYGFPVSQWAFQDEDLLFPLINAGSPEAHPAHALADIACMKKSAKELEGVGTAWIGCPNGAFYSLLEAMVWFPFSMNICIPSQFDASLIKLRIKELGIPAKFIDKPDDAVKDCRFVYAGFRGPLSDSELGPYKITMELLARADKDAKFLLSASPLRSIPVSSKVLQSPANKIASQARYRLGVHKRILHWILQ